MHCIIGQTPSSSTISPIDCRSAQPGKTPIPSVHSKDNGTANVPVDHEHHIITQSGTESIQMSSIDHEDHTLAVHDHESSHQLQHNNSKDESVPTAVSGDICTSVALSASNCTCSIEPPDQILFRCNHELITSLSLDPLGIAKILLAEGFIPENIQEQMLLSSRTPQEKATILVTAIRKKIEIAPKRYREFLCILSQQKWMKDILDILLSRGCEVHKMDLQRSIDDHSLITSNLKGQKLKLHVHLAVI